VFLIGWSSSSCETASAVSIVCWAVFCCSIILIGLGAFMLMRFGSLVTIRGNMENIKAKNQEVPAGDVFVRPSGHVLIGVGGRSGC